MYLPNQYQLLTDCKNTNVLFYIIYKLLVMDDLPLDINSFSCPSDLKRLLTWYSM